MSKITKYETTINNYFVNHFLLQQISQIDSGLKTNVRDQY